jgi:hypothetical protein
LVPPAELARHLAELSAGEEVRTDEELFRAVLDRLGLRRLTENAKAVLARASELVPMEESLLDRAENANPGSNALRVVLAEINVAGR